MSQAALVLLLVASNSGAADLGPVVNRELGFSFVPPAGFAPFPSGNQTTDDLYSFIHGDLESPDGALVFQVQRLGGPIVREALDVSQLPEESRPSFEPVTWKGFTLQIGRLEQGAGIVYLVQVPLKREAIQLLVAGLPQRDPQMKQALRSVLDSLQGESNWLTNSERVTRLVDGTKRLLMTLVFFAGIGLLIRHLFRRKKTAA